MSILTPLFTALMAAGSYIRIPLGVVPITIQSLFMFMAPLLLKPKEAVKSVLLYLFLGTIGLPIFSTGGGIAALIGPTGGFLLGMIPSVIAGSLLSSRKKDSVAWNILVVIVMEVVLYAFGIVWLMMKLRISFKAAMTIGCAPFIVGDVIKMLTAASTAVRLYPEIRNMEKDIEA